MNRYKISHLLISEDFLRYLFIIALLFLNKPTFLFDVYIGVYKGSGTPRPKTILARDSSARTLRPIFKSGTAQPTLVGLLGPFFMFFFYVNASSI